MSIGEFVEEHRSMIPNDEPITLFALQAYAITPNLPPIAKNTFNNFAGEVISNIDELFKAVVKPSSHEAAAQLCQKCRGREGDRYVIEENGEVKQDYCPFISINGVCLKQDDPEYYHELTGVPNPQQI